MNSAYVAHIVAASPGGARGDPVRSPLLRKELTNVMLMCATHHRLIDEENVEGHPEDLLLEMKAEHEQRMLDVTSAQPERQSEPLLFGARVGKHDSPLTYARAREAMLPGRYPARAKATLLGMRGVALNDDDDEFWTVEVRSLKRQFADRVTRPIRDGDCQHLSVFAFAPQPLLVLLGALLGEVLPADVYQLHREPQTWQWPEGEADLSLKLDEPESPDGPPALVFSISATVTRERITAVLGPTASIWMISIPRPSNTALKFRNQLGQFRQVVRLALDRIKAAHGQDAILHVFPALPVSAAVELGRAWMPKADLPLLIYDESRAQGGFGHRLTISPEEVIDGN